MRILARLELLGRFFHSTSPPPIKPIAARHLAADLQDTTRFYAQAVMIEALLRVVAPGSLWGERLADLLAQHPKVRLDRLGFPEGWQQRSVWTS